MYTLRRKEGVEKVKQREGLDKDKISQHKTFPIAAPKQPVAIPDGST
jgi:hypothetical protein